MLKNSATVKREAQDLRGGPPSLLRRLVVFVPLVVFAGLAVLFLVRLFAGDPSRLPSALIGKPAPDFALPPLEGLTRDGKPVPGLAVSDLRLAAGDGPSVTLVNVWASWCAPCREEHPLLMQLAHDPRIRLVGIGYKDSPENARRFLGAFGNPFATVGADLSGRTAIDWGVYGVPETFIVGPDGIVRYKHVGPLTQDSIRSELLPVIAALAGR
jgi:cytochrome c biogenesis protein CcmG, thiol:disulfide interchange protein DsbE